MIRIFFGNIRCGKTTSIMRDVKLRQKKGQVCFTNFDNKLCYGLQDYDIKTLGQLWTFPVGSHVHIDESGIEFNNRNYKAFPQSLIKWFKLSGHFQVDVDVWSQSFEDLDVTIRRLASELWYVQRLGPFTMIRRVDKFLTVDKESHQIIDGYKMPKLISQFIPFSRKVFYLYWRRPYYKYFDTHSRSPLPFIDSKGVLHNEA